MTEAAVVWAGVSSTLELFGCYDQQCFYTSAVGEETDVLSAAQRCLDENKILASFTSSDVYEWATSMGL